MVNRLPSELRAARKSAGLTLREAAQRAGVGAGALSMLERGQRRPSLGTLIALGQALDARIVIDAAGVSVSRQE
jgi:transcriptional regulator with XRE-family HTH domain